MKKMRLIKNFVLILFFINQTQSYSQERINAFNITWQVVNDNVEILYDLPDDLTQEVYVQPILIRDSDKNFKITPKSLFGDYGKGYFKGAFKRIVWSYLLDVPQGFTGDDYSFLINVYVYELGIETLEARQQKLTLYTGQEIIVQCPYGNSGNVRIANGATFLSKPYPELLTGDVILSYNEQKLPVNNCSDLNEALRGNSLTVKRNGETIEFKLPGIKEREQKEQEERAIQEKADEEKRIADLKVKEIEMKKQVRKAKLVRKPHWTVGLSYFATKFKNSKANGVSVLLNPFKNKNNTKPFQFGFYLDYLKVNEENANNIFYFFPDSDIGYFNVENGGTSYKYSGFSKYNINSFNLTSLGIQLSFTYKLKISAKSEIDINAILPLFTHATTKAEVTFDTYIKNNYGFAQIYELYENGTESLNLKGGLDKGGIGALYRLSLNNKGNFGLLAGVRYLWWFPKSFITHKESKKIKYTEDNKDYSAFSNQLNNNLLNQGVSNTPDFNTGSYTKPDSPFNSLLFSFGITF